MRTIRLNVPNDLFIRAENAMSKKIGRQNEIADPANPGQSMLNPKSKRDVLLEQLLAHLVDTVATEESATSGENARQATRTAVEDDFQAITIDE